MVAPIEPLRVAAIELLHEAGEMPLRCLQIEMVVVRHQAVAMDPIPEGFVQHL